MKNQKNNKYYSTITDKTKKQIKKFLDDNEQEKLGYWIYRESQELANKASNEMITSNEKFNKDFDKIAEEIKKYELECKKHNISVLNFDNYNKKLKELYSNLIIDEESIKLIDKLRNKKY